MNRLPFLPIGTMQRARAYYARRLPLFAAEAPERGTWEGDCPRCGQASLVIVCLTGFWSCIACGRSGDIYQFEEMMAGLDPIEAILAVDRVFHQHLEAVQETLRAASQVATPPIVLLEEPLELVV